MGAAGLGVSQPTCYWPDSSICTVDYATGRIVEIGGRPWPERTPVDWQSIVKTVAPWIGTALGGPLGGMAVEAAASAMGLGDKTTDALKQALGGATPEQMLALKQADQTFAVQMRALGFKQVADLEAIAAGDRKSARDMQTSLRSVVPALLTWFLIGAFVGTLVALFTIDVPVANRDVMVYMVGQLSGFAAAAVAFWLGTTRQSENKTGLLAKAGPIE